jgi:hypothetical protein
MPTYIAKLFPIARSWNPLRPLSTCEYSREMFTVKYHLTMKNTTMLSEVT